MKRKRQIQLFFILVCCLNIVDASHFRGGLVMWRTVGVVNRTSNVNIEITQRYGWRRDFSGETSCDDTTIGTGRLQGDTGDFVCRVGCNGIGSLGSVQVYCTDFSIIEPQWMVGERTYSVSVPYIPVFEASFSSCCWISTLVVGRDGTWEVRAKMNLDRVLTRRNGNASPKTKMSPVINLLAGCNHTITIPVEDEDGDDIRCRWSNASLGECGNVCNGFPGATLDERECTISYSATNEPGFFAVTIQIEDYYSPLDSAPFSSTPLQFLVNVYESEYENASCYSKPTFAWPTRRDGACVGIPPNSTFQETIIGQSGGIGVSIIDISTQSPVGLRKSGLGTGPGVNQWHVNLTWTPDDLQAGNNIFCFVAVDSTGANSDQRCIYLAVGAYPPSVNPGSLNPSGKILPNHNTWQLDFDRSFIRPLSSSFIRFHDNLGHEIFRIDTATNPSVRFPNSTAMVIMSFQTRYTFTEKAEYYVTIDNGIAIGLEACGPESVGIYDPNWWRLRIRDVTPPVLIFAPRLPYTRDSVIITWSYDEDARSRCAIQSPSSLTTIPCNDSLDLSDLEEGAYTLFVQATDDEGNSKQYSTSWYVDLTPPTATVSSGPPSLSNRTSVSFSVQCADQSVCQLFCGVSSPGTSPTFRNCSDVYTVSLLTDGSHTFSVYGVDIVGNIGSTTTYTWVTDTIPPTISPVANVTISCGNPYQPSATGIPSCADNIDQSPTLTFADNSATNCRTLRTWSAMDEAGNTAQFVQVISFINTISPSVGGTPELYIPCGETDRLTSSDYVVRALNISSACGRQLSVAFTDTSPIEQCGITVTREWIITDDCGSVTHFSQTMHILSPSNPEFPDNGQKNVNIRQSLGWPPYPGSLGYNLYVWRFGSSQPLVPTAFVPTWSRRYSPTEAFPPNTEILWKIGYIVTFNGTTADIPGPTWGFKTESFADLCMSTISVPQTSFSGSSATVTWRADNIGNVSTSESTGIFYDAIYVSRSINFADATIATVVPQIRYVDPSDGYVSNGNIHLGSSDIGKFYIFVVADIYGYVRDYSFDNNRLERPQAMQVQLTPPPNIKVASVSLIGSVFSGETIDLRYVVENTGIGITVATGWYDAIFLSKDDQLSTADDQRLAKPYHSGALASGSQYIATVSIDIPNAIYGPYAIIVATDIDNNVFENNDEGDNDNALNVTINLSPFPDLIVTNVSAKQRVLTGEVLTVSAVIKNAGAGAPFEYSWDDGLVIYSTTDSIQSYSAYRQHVGGQQLIPRTEYRVEFEYKIPPSMSSGDYSVFVIADARRQVFEFQFEDNNNMSTAIRIAQLLPDLTVGNSSVAVITNSTGNYLTYNLSVVNVDVGDVQIPFWEDRLVLTDAFSYVADVLTSYASAFHNKTYDVIDRTVYLPVAYFGLIDVYVSLDARNKILETDKSNNYAKITTISIKKRDTDLAVTSLVAQEAAKAGSTILLRWTVENRGNMAIGSWLTWNDQITMSFGLTSTTMIHEELITIAAYLQPGDRYSRQANVTIPQNFAGSYKLRVTTGQYVTGGEGQEVNITNNMRERTIAITTPPSPDFKLQSCQSEITTIANTRLLSISCTIVNSGNSMDVPVNWTDQIYLTNAGGSSIVNAYISDTRKLLSRQTYTLSTTFIITPALEGYVQIEIPYDITNAVTKPNSGISRKVIKVPTPIFVPLGPSPTLTAAIQPLSSTKFFGGASFTVNCLVSNTGSAGLPLSSWTDSMYLMSIAGATKLQVISQGFLIDTVIQNTALDAGGYYNESFRGKLPYFVNGDVYVYVIIDVNNRLPVLDDGKAAYFNTSIHIEQGPLPDLVVAFSDNSTLVVQSGDNFDMLYSVTNIGNSTAAGKWFDTVYLSQDKFIDPFDTPLQTLLRLRQLNVGETYAQSATVAIPYDLPGHSYYFIVVANVRKECVESSYDNNANNIRVDIQVLPAVDLVVFNVTSSKLNVTYLEELSFGWMVENNGSIATIGRKCDSVYLSTDDKWDITDITVVDSKCGYFSLQPKGSALDSKDYSGQTIVPSVAEGQYKAIVRTRSNVRDYNLTNNIGIGEFSLLITPLTISLNENKTVALHTNQYMTFKLTGIPVGIGITVSLTTSYEFAYHRLYLKQNTPPVTNDYDFASKQLGTTRQRVSIAYTKSGIYYLMIESSSSFPDVAYQMYFCVKEAKFEVTSVYPSSILPDLSVTLKIYGTLFPQKMRAYLHNDTFEMAATEVFRYVSEEAYATFDTSTLKGSYSLSLRGEKSGSFCELENSVTVSGFLGSGRLQLGVVTSGAVRAGRSTVVQVKVENVGYSDVYSPVVLIETGGNSKVVSTEAGAGTLPVQQFQFSPTEKNRPPLILPPRSSSTFSFEVIPNNNDFTGRELLYLEALDDDLLTQLIASLESTLKPLSWSNDTWKMVWKQVGQCFGNRPSTLLNTISGHFTQYYTSLSGFDDVVGHLVEIVDGQTPSELLHSYVDVTDELLYTMLPFEIERNYFQRLSVRRTNGPFGRGWSCPILEMSVNVSVGFVLLKKERQEYAFLKSGREYIFKSSRYPDDQISINGSTVNYLSGNLLYYFDGQTGVLKRVEDTRKVESIVIGYTVDNQPISIDHSSGRYIQIIYDSSGFVSNVQLFRDGMQMKQVFYTYSSAGLLLSVSGQSVTEYEYTPDGDLTLVRGSSGETETFSYDDGQLLKFRSTYAVGQQLVRTLQTTRHCDGRVDVVLLPLNLSSSSLYGFGGQTVQEQSSTGLPNHYYVDSFNNEVNLVIGDDLKVAQTFNAQSRTFTSVDANSDKRIVRMDSDGHVTSLGDEQSPYYDGTYENGFLTRMNYRDGTYTKLAYNDKAQVSSYTSRDASTAHYQYDSNNRIVRVQSDDGITVYSYNDDGLVSDITATDGKTTTINYNADGLPVSVRYADGTQIDYTYDRCNQRTSVTSNNGYNATYLYDSLCRLVRIVDGSGSLVGSFEYDDRSNLYRKLLGNGMYTEYDYDSSSFRLRQLRNFSPNGTVLSSYVYSYDDWGYRVRMDTHAGVWTYAYDGLGQLIEWTSPYSSAPDKIEYDPSRNRKSKESSNVKVQYYANPMMQYIQYGNSQNFSYDRNGNLAQKNVLNNDGTVHNEEYTYNADGKLSRIVAGRLVCEYKYNVFGAMSNKLCSDGTNVSYTADPFGTYGANILVQYTGDSQDKDFVYHAMQYGLVGTIKSTDFSRATFFLFDGDGSTVQTTNRDAIVTREYSYDPFGGLINHPRLQDDNMFRFMGQFGEQIINETSGIVLLRFRLYDTEHGRFFSPDPVGIYGSPSNPYCYGNNNPATFKDTNGLVPVVVVGAVVGAVGGAVYYFTTLKGIDNFKWTDFGKAIAGGTVSGFVGAYVGTTYALGFLGRGVLGAGTVIVGKLVKGENPFAGDGWVDVAVGFGMGPIRFGPPGWSSYSRKALVGLGARKGAHWALDWVRSRDPNEISVMPAGYGDGRFINLKQPLEYKIEFENHPNATAPAQKVVINCPLDASLEMGTFMVGSFAFDILKKDSGSISSRYTGTIDARETKGILVYVEGRLLASDSAAIWLFQTINPLTNEASTDPAVGFLPPNNGTTGQGYVTFSIMPKENSETLAKILGSATITFDDNPPIDTPVIFRTLDVKPPTIKMNASIVSGGVLVQFDITEVGSGVKSIDLLSVEGDVSKELLTAITEPAVVVNNLQPNKLYTLVARATDNVDNQWQDKPENGLSIFVPAECPGNCSARGVCTTSGTCQCDAGFGGENCSINATSLCEPPMVDLSYTNATQNASVAIFLSASAPSSRSNGTAWIVVTCSPASAGLSRGARVNDETLLTADDFGDMLLLPPEYFSGVLTCNVSASLADECEVTNRTVRLALYVLSDGQLTTQSLVTGDTMSLSTFDYTRASVVDGTGETRAYSSVTPSESVGFNVSTSTADRGSAFSLTGTSPLPSITGRNGGDDATVSFSSALDAARSTAGNEAGRTQQGTSPGSVDTFRVSSSQTPVYDNVRSSGTQTTAVTPQRVTDVGGTQQRTSQETARPISLRTSVYDSGRNSSIQATTRSLSAAVTSGNAENVTHAWSAWSPWGSCSRTCDIGVQERHRQCSAAPGACGGPTVERRLCNSSACSGIYAEANEGTLLSLSAADTTKLLASLSIFLRWISVSINRYCAQSMSTCCTSVFGMFTASSTQRTGDFATTELISIGAGFPQQYGTPDMYRLKVIVKVDKDVVRSQCISGSSRRRRQANIVYLERTIINAAVLQNQLDIERNLTLSFAEVIDTNETVVNQTTVSVPPTTFDGNVRIIIGVVVGFSCLMAIVAFCVVMLIRRNSKRRSVPGRFSSAVPRQSPGVNVGNLPHVTRSHQHCYNGPRLLPTYSPTVDFSGRTIVAQAQQHLVNDGYRAMITPTCGQHRRRPATSYPVYWNRAYVGSSLGLDTPPAI